jgi:hypothetical protein
MAEARTTHPFQVDSEITGFFKFGIVKQVVLRASSGEVVRAEPRMNWLFERW